MAESVAPASPAPDGASAGTRTFLFSDVRGYSAFVERAGDRAAAELLAAYRDVVRAVIAAHDGAEIKTEGDSFYVVFASASAAVEAGLAIVARAAEASTADRPIRVGVGIHSGETVETSDGLVGGAVNIAARVCAKAAAGEVLVTDTVRALTRTSLSYRYTSLGAQALKGISGGIPLYRVEAAPSSRMSRLRRQLVARRGRFARVGGAMVLIGLVAAAASVYAANRGPDCVTLGAATRHVVARIDPDRGCVVGTYRVGSWPVAVAASDGIVWVASRDSTVYRIDAVSGASTWTAVFGVPVALAAGPAGDAYLVTDDPTVGLPNDDTKDRAIWIDPSGSVREIRALPRIRRATAADDYQAIAFADDLAWITDAHDGTAVLVRFESGIPERVPLEGRIGPIDAGAGAVWIGSTSEATVYRIDGRDAKLEPIELPDDHGGVFSLDVATAAVWLGRTDGYVTRLDPQTKGRQQFSLGARVSSISAGSDAVWIVDEEGSLSRLDPSTGEVTPVPVGGRAADVAIASDGGVWVAIQPR